MIKKTFMISILVVLFDLFSKYYIFSTYALREKANIIGNIFSIYPIKNYGAAFSIFENENIFLTFVSLGILAYLIYNIRKLEDKFVNYFSFGLLIGGLIGNLYDRLFLHHVRDFISFTAGSFEFAIFNIADVAIVVGAIILIVRSFMGGKNENNL